MGDCEVKLLGSWPSPFVLRVKIALHLKSVNYEYIEENQLGPKSELLQKLNPLYKKVPVFVHNDSVFCESQVIVQYIDEVWSNAPSILPFDPKERANSRFWTTYVDDKLFPAMVIALIAETEDVKKAATAELEEGVMVMEEAFRKLSKGKAFFNGDNMGYLDITLGPIFIWIEIIEKIIDVKVLTEASTPSLLRWAHHSFSSHEVVKALLPDNEDLAEFCVNLIPIARARKKRAREGRTGDEIEHFPIPSRITVRKRPTVSAIELNEPEIYSNSTGGISSSKIERREAEDGLRRSHKLARHQDVDQYSGAEDDLSN